MNDKEIRTRSQYRKLIGYTDLTCRAIPFTVGSRSTFFILDTRSQTMISHKLNKVGELEWGENLNTYSVEYKWFFHVLATFMRAEHDVYTRFPMTAEWFYLRWCFHYTSLVVFDLGELPNPPEKLDKYNIYNSYLKKITRDQRLYYSKQKQARESGELFNFLCGRDKTI